ncbi:MFS general substrate transporter [Thozetella sp. PMI_491]|nr:MFS general substrate transporter [Thozetella sp. PMI_491]
MEKQESRIANHRYSGGGTPEDPFVVEFLDGDPHNAMNFPTWRKWLITTIVTASVFAITLTSSAYSSSSQQIRAELDAEAELFALGISLFVLGFAIGPSLWAPLSELYGRRIWFVFTHGCVVAFVAGAAGCKTMAELVIFRFLGGFFGASPLTNSGGVISDLFPAAERGVAIAIFSAAPFLGPILGPIMGGFMTITVGWRWVQGVCCIFIGVVGILGVLLVPETYAPVILHKRAKTLSQKTGKCYRSVLEINSGGVELSEVFGKALQRPWVLLFREPIVLVSSVYMAIIYGTIYMFMGAFPIVYSELRGWGAGVGGLAFIGLAVGMILGLAYILFVDQVHYRKLGAHPPPEARLPPGIIGGLALPIGMFAFAWTNSPSIHWSASIILSAPFGFGCVLVFLSCMNYLLDSYTIYAASVLAAGAMLRAFFGFAFPLFTKQMYQNLGIHWASSIPAFLTLLCLPFPFAMVKYGEVLRMKCKYAQEAAVLTARLREQTDNSSDGQSDSA